jgi:hypothetical protein
MGGINFRTLLYFIASFAVVAVIYFGLTRAVGSIVAAGIVIGLLVVLLLVTLWLTRTKRGNKVAEKIMLRLLKTRFGPRIRRWQIRTYAKQQGVSLTDASGRERTEMELMLEVSPEAEGLRKQLRTMNPQQRAQAMRMLAAQQELVDRGELDPNNPPDWAARGPRQPGMSGRPQTGSGPRSGGGGSRKRKRR